MRRLMAFLTLICSCLYVRAQEIKPYLRLEPGTHSANVTGIDIDAAQRFVVSTSYDKTARVWDLRTGKLLRILRPPIGDGEEGMLYTVAISPDGKSVAVAGFTGASTSGNFPIYIFDRDSGAIHRVISGLPDVTHGLAYSPNGRYLAATIHGKNGVRVYETKQYAEVTRDTSDYLDDTYGVRFDSSGRLATASYDGNVRLYDADFHRLRKVKPPGGNRAYSVAFSPDGKLLAVGFDDAARVNILSGSDLGFRYSIQPADSPFDIARLSWSAEGHTFCAGGRYSDSSGRNPILCWDAEGKGVMSSYPIAGDTIRGLRVLNDGAIAFAAADGTIGVLDHKGATRWRTDSELLDYRADRSLTRVSSDGNVLESAALYYDKTQWMQHTVRFSVQQRKLEVGPTSDAAVASPITKGLSIDGWKDSDAPTLNGKPLSIEHHEESRSLAIGPKQDSFILGADWYIYKFDLDGKQIWDTPVQGTAWSVNISADGRFVVAALGDGTLRWYTFDKGEEVLALFVDRDFKRWVAWTRSGYYDASPGGEELIGWQVNNGPDKAGDFYPASRFRETRYRPDVVSKVVTTLDEAEAVRLANAARGKGAETTSIAQALPPVVSITSPEDGTRASSTAVTLRYAIRAPSGEPVTRLRVLIDGRPAQGVQAVPKAGDQQSLTVTIPERDCQVSLIAENRFSASVPATVHLSWAGTARGVAVVGGRQEEFTVKPMLYVLAVGESNYQDKALKLGFPAKDAKDFAAAMQRQKGILYRDVEVKLLPDSSKIDIEDGLDWLQHQVTGRDVGMLFLAGHGVNDSANTYYFLPANADMDHLKATGLVFSEIKTTMENIAGKVVMFVDTCHSGNIMGARRGGLADINGIVNELASAENGVVVFAASTGRQYSLEDPQWQNGAFTKALVEGIDGNAALSRESGKITVNMLDVYISERVKVLTKGEQTPTTTKPETVPDFPVAVKQ